ncbi:hypothetical protein OS493_004744 [Desmophyllum pertusum]|uniref:G-protein coupled receptors family 1 profile domain-containing protein n=1 Tax=Desmophyllum pertusum TaxID=174260 RepID=A0A9X0CZF6_9CNID|nr:hypothetical protein OS493_004744 [Desmophyllum pertusum]
MNLPPLQAEARLKTDIKASKTIAIMTTAYFAGYVPAIVYAIVAVQKKTLDESCVYLSCAVNPIIYSVRSSRFRSAFRQFLKNPLGSSDIREKPSGQNNGELQAPQAWNHVGRGSIEKTPEVLSSEAQSPYQGTGKQTSAGNEELRKEYGLTSDSRKPKRALQRSSTLKVHPLEITDLDKLNSIEASRKPKVKSKESLTAQTSNVK